MKAWVSEGMGVRLTQLTDMFLVNMGMLVKNCTRSRDRYLITWKAVIILIDETLLMPASDELKLIRG